MANYDLSDDEDYIKSIIDTSTFSKYEDVQLLNALRGHSNIPITSMPQMESDDMMFVYFTRPNLNLSDLSLSRNRRYQHHTSKEPNEMNNLIRATLSPYEVKMGLVSNIANTNSPFIPMLSNTLLELSGMPDEVIKSWDSPAGMVGEQWGHANSTIEFKGSIEINLTFQSIAGGPVAKLFDVWTTYESDVRYGRLMPHPYCIASRETDYFSAIYILILNANFKIKHIAKTRGYPIANPKGEKFTYRRGEDVSGKYPTFQTRFKCYGVDYDDPALLQEFNTSMMAFNSDIKSTVLSSDKSVVEVPAKFKALFQNECYPYIDLRYNTLEFLLPTSKFEVKDKPLNNVDEEKKDDN
jgi:hypothetical protein